MFLEIEKLLTRNTINNYGAVDGIRSNLTMARLCLGQSTICEDLKVRVTGQVWGEWVRKNFSDSIITCFDSNDYMVIDEQNKNMFVSSVHREYCDVSIIGSESWISQVKSQISADFDSNPCHIEWVYNERGDSIDLKLDNVRTPVEEMYPWLNGESLASYYDRYMQSDANILILTGDPGLGKTTFIRGLLFHHNCSAMVSYDANVLNGDSVFANFMSNSTSIMILEDSDVFLGARTDGNSLVQKFLNIGDGLISTRDKKMIFSTNLPSIKDIDPALTRPGRCFDVVSFEALNKHQAQKLADRMNVEFVEKSDSSDYTVAEILNKPQRIVSKGKFGF